MSYRFYGGTRETSIERDMADTEWLRKRGAKKELENRATAMRATNTLTVVIVGLFVFGIIALAVWGFQNLNIEFNLLAFLFNPITLVLMPTLWLWSIMHN